MCGVFIVNMGNIQRYRTFFFFGFRRFWFALVLVLAEIRRFLTLFYVL